MRRYTTPTHEMVVTGVDLTGCTVYVSYRQGCAELVKQVEPVYDGRNSTVAVTLTQGETSMFAEGDIDIQVNWIHPDGSRDASNIAQLKAKRNLLDREVTHDG